MSSLLKYFIYTISIMLFFSQVSEAQTDDTTGALTDDMTGTLLDDTTGALTDDMTGTLLDDTTGALTDDMTGVLTDDTTGALLDDTTSGGGFFDGLGDIMEDERNMMGDAFGMVRGVMGDFMNVI